MAGKVFRILLITIMIFQTASLFAQESEDSDAASINGILIKSADVRREMNMMYQRAVQQGVYPDNSEIEAYWNTALNALIGRELLYQHAVSMNYEADEQSIDDYVNALTMNYGGTESLEAVLSQQGMDLERLRTDTARYQIISSFVEEVMRPGISVTDEQCRTYYDENSAWFKTEETVRASHILLTIEDGADEQQKADALEKIEKIRERIVAGEEFAALAKEFSDCPSSENGGDLGEFGRGMMVPPFDRAAFELEPGELSMPVLTQFGYHLILLTEKKAGERVAFEEVKQQISDYLTDIGLERKINEFVAGLRESAEVKLF